MIDAKALSSLAELHGQLPESTTTRMDIRKCFDYLFDKYWTEDCVHRLSLSTKALLRLAASQEFVEAYGNVKHQLLDKMLERQSDGKTNYLFGWPVEIYQDTSATGSALIGGDEIDLTPILRGTKNERQDRPSDRNDNRLGAASDDAKVA